MVRALLRSARFFLRSNSAKTLRSRIRVFRVVATRIARGIDLSRLLPTHVNPREARIARKTPRASRITFVHSWLIDILLPPTSYHSPGPDYPSAGVRRHRFYRHRAGITCRRSPADTLYPAAPSRWLKAMFELF